MDIGDARLEEARKNLTERIEKYDGRIVTVLKGHLSAEQNLNNLLRAAKKKWKGLKFAGKINVAKEIHLPDLSEQLWEVLTKGNQLRNAVAHGDKESAIAQRIADLKKALLSWSTPEQKPNIEAMSETQMIRNAFESTGCFLIVAAEKLQGKY